MTAACGLCSTAATSSSRSPGPVVDTQGAGGSGSSVSRTSRSGAPSRGRPRPTTTVGRRPATASSGAVSVPSSATTTSGRAASGPIDPSAAAAIRRSAASAASSTSVGLTGADPNLGAISTRGDLDQPLALREHLARQGATLVAASERPGPLVGSSAVGAGAASRWAGSGGMHLTGWPDGPPLLDGWAALAAATEVAELLADLALAAGTIDRGRRSRGAVRSGGHRRVAARRADLGRWQLPAPGSGRRLAGGEPGAPR